MCGRGRGRSRQRKWITLLLAAVWVLEVFILNPMEVQAAGQEESIENLVLIAVRDINSDSMAGYTTGVMIDGGDYSIVVTWQIDGIQYQCAGIIGGNEIKLEFMGAANGIAFFETDRNYGGFTQDEILGCQDLDKGERILSYAYVVDDRIINTIDKEDYIKEFYENEGLIYVETEDEFEMSYMGGMVLTETGQLAGVVVPTTLNNRQCLFISMGIEAAEGNDSGESGVPAPDRKEGDEPSSERRDNGGEGEKPDESGSGEGEGAEPEENGDDSSDGTPNLLEDSYFMKLVFLLFIAMAVSLYTYINRKNKNGGKTVLIEEQPSAAGTPAEIILVGIGGFFQGRGFDISKKPIIFGRNPAWCTEVYPKDTKGISSLHCRIEIIDGKILLTDLGSTYGTFLENGRKIPANTPCELHRGERFYLADRANMFQIQ